MKTNPLRIIRISAAAACIAAMTLLFADWGGGASADTLRGAAAWLARLQFIPAVLAAGIAPLIAVTLLTLLFGRIYCSVLCPLGIMQDGANFIARRRTARPAAGRRYIPARTWLRYSVLAVAAILAVAGTGAAVALIDPYGIFGRIVYDGLRPAVQACNNALAVFAGDTFGREPITVSWLSAAIAAVSLAVTGTLAWRGGRTYCNSFCPVGTLLGTVGRAAAFRIRIDADKCTGCRRCESRCKSSCIDTASRTVDNSRCVVCFDCLDACTRGAIAFAPAWGAPTREKTAVSRRSVHDGADTPSCTNGRHGAERNAGTGLAAGTNPLPEGGKHAGGSTPSTTAAGGTAASCTAAETVANSPAPRQADTAFDPSRRRFLTAVVAAAAAIPAAKAQSVQNSFRTVVREKEPFRRRRPVTPPGSTGADRLHAKCISCHLCVSKCPGHVLQPAVAEYGLEGIMHPVMRYDKGYCLYECTLCGEVCPTGAILPLDGETKKQTFIGHAVFRKGLCVVRTDGVECGNCADRCPAEAIKMVRSAADGREYPEVEKELCIGCGRCEYVCPASPFSAIHVEGYEVHGNPENGRGHNGTGKGNGKRAINEGR